LTLELMGERGFRVQSDPVKLQRIVQNLVLNAIHYTTTGRVEVSWGTSGLKNPAQWVLQVKDTGPGLAPVAGSDVQEALERATQNARDMARGAQLGQVVHAQSEEAESAEEGVSQAQGHGTPLNHGEGIGLAIVKRLCELLDATIHVDTGRDGTCFRIQFPTQYPSESSADDSDAGNGLAQGTGRLPQAG
jgi:signal transduction histidine kinase